MSRTSPKPVRILALVLATLLVAAACGDDSSGLSNEAFCAELEEQDANEDLNLDNPEDLAKFEQLIEDAPPDVKPALEEFAEVATEFNEIDEDDPEAFEDAFGAMFALFANEDFLRAVKDLSIFMADECGLDVPDIDQIRELDPEDPSSLFGGLDGEGSGGVTVDGGDDDGSDAGDEEEDPTSASALGDYLEEQYGDTTWQPELLSRGIGTFGSNADVTVTFAEGAGSEEDALAACNAVREWTGQAFNPLDTVRIAILDSDGQELAAAEDGEDCVVA